VDLCPSPGPQLAGDVIVHEGDHGDALFFLLSGTVDVQVQLDDGRTHRLSTVGPGVAFGELAILDQSRRSADVVAADDSVLARISVDDLRDLGIQFLQMMATIYRTSPRTSHGACAANSRCVRSINDGAAGCRRPVDGVNQCGANHHPMTSTTRAMHGAS
jgi:hypothetical protein